MFITKNKVDAEYIKKHIHEQVVYYHTKAKEFKALYEEETDPNVRAQLERLWMEYHNIEAQISDIYWDFYMDERFK